MTRKPWKVDYDGPSLPIITSSDPERGIVALIRTDDEDAHLISAAHELLAACEEFVRKCECGEARSIRSYAEMKAAIAKAKGQL